MEEGVREETLVTMASVAVLRGRIKSRVAVTPTSWPDIARATV